MSVVEPCLWLYSGVRVIAGAVGLLPSVVDSDKLGVALGGLEAVDASDGEEDDASASTNTTKVCGVRKNGYLLNHSRSTPTCLGTTYLDLVWDSVCSSTAPPCLGQFSCNLCGIFVRGSRSVK